MEGRPRVACGLPVDNLPENGPINHEDLKNPRFKGWIRKVVVRVYPNRYACACDMVLQDNKGATLLVPHSWVHAKGGRGMVEIYEEHRDAVRNMEAARDAAWDRPLTDFYGETDRKDWDERRAFYKAL